MFLIYFIAFNSSKNIPPLINAIGSNITVKNCYFDNIGIPQTSSLMQFSDKSSYYSQLPYVLNQNYALFENITFNLIAAFPVPLYQVDKSLLTLPLLVYGSHSADFPLHYSFTNLIMNNNIASILIYLYFLGYTLTYKVFSAIFIFN